jgi:hypothetical protein
VVWLTTDHQAFGNHYEFQGAYRGRLRSLERLKSEGQFFPQA